MEKYTDLRSIIQLAKRRALYFLIPAILLGLSGSIAVMKLPAIYRSQATILVESQQIPPDLVKSTVTAMADERLQTIQQRTLSRDNILALARKFGIMAQQKNLSPSELVDRVRERIEISPVNPMNLGQRAQSDRLAVAFTVSYEDEDPQRAAKVANELVTIILSADATTRVTQAAETTSFLDKENARLSSALGDIENQIAKFRLENSDALPDKLAYNMALSERMDKNVADIAREIQGIDEQKRMLAFEASVRKVAAGGTDGGASLKPAVDTQIDTLRAEIAAKSAIYSDQHPEMRSLRKELRALEAQRQKALASATAPASAAPQAADQSVDAQLTREKQKALDDRAAFLKGQSQQYEASALQLKQIIARTPDVGAQLGELERKRANIQKSLEDISGKLAQARLGQRMEEDQQSERFEVVEQPIVPDQPSRPNRLKFLAAVGAAAFVGGGGLAFTSEFFDDRIRSSADLMSRVGVRPIAAIPYIPTGRERRRRLLKLFGMLVLLAAAAAAGLAAIHTYVMPLDIIAAKIMRHF